MLIACCVYVSLACAGDCDSLLSHALCTEPQMPPHDVKVERLNGTAMNVSWTRLSVIEAQSVAISYVVSYFPLNVRERQIREVVVSVNQSYVVISGLDPVIIYQVEVFASNDHNQSTPANAEYVGEFTYVIRLHVL